MFPLLPSSAVSPMSGLVALDFGPAALIVGGVLLMIAAWLAAHSERSPAQLPPTPPRARRSRSVAQLRRLGRNLRQRPERRSPALRPV